MIFWLFGFPGSGKDYCAQHFSQMINAHYINVDDFLTPEDKQKLLSGDFTTKDRLKKLERTTTHIKNTLKKEKDIVAADSLPDHISRNFLREKFGKNITFILVKVDPKIHEKRLHERKNHFFTEKLLLDYVAKNWEDPSSSYETLENNEEGTKSITNQLKKIYDRAKL